MIDVADSRLFLLVLQAGAIATRLGNLNAILVSQLIGLLNQLLHLLHDSLILLLILLLVRRLLLLVARRIVWHLLLLLLLLRLLRLIIPRIGDLIATDGTATLLLLGLSCGLL